MTICEHGRSYRCEDCGACTCTRHLREYFMVTDAIWRKHGVPWRRATVSGMLCIGCLEARMGRRLTRADFTDCKLNTEPGIARSLRLRARLTSPPGPLASSR